MLSKKNSIHNILYSLLNTNYNNNLCFVLMPFLPEMKEIYTEIIKPIVIKSGMECIRSDEIYNPGEILNDIIKSIISARIVIAELTGRNANVMYELGMSHMLKKKTILLTQKIDDVPFDLRHLRCINYKLGPIGIEKLKEDLFKTLNNILNEPEIDSYIVTYELRQVNLLEKKIKNFSKEIEYIKKEKFLKSRSDLEPIENLAVKAKDIFIGGPTLAVIAMKQNFFIKKLKEGCILRFLIPNPNIDSSAVQGLINYWHTTPEGFKSEVTSAITNFKILKDLLKKPEIDLLSLHYIDNVLPLSLLMIDGNFNNGYIQVELLPYKTASPDRPNFILKANGNSEWYSLFRDKIEDMWKNSVSL